MLELVRSTNHSRLPVYEGSIDNIIGVLQIRKYIKAYLRERGSLDIRPLIDEVLFTHQSSKIDELLPVMSRRKLNMSVVTDNYGGTLGIVTVEDILEELVGFFSGMAKTNSPHKTPVVGSYIFGAGCYIFFSTIFELLGIQAVTTKGHSIALPAPIADINGAIAMGITSYAFILIAGAVCNGAKGVLGVLKDFSLPISMSFRLFGALLSGLLVTELVYYYVSLSFVLPVFVGVMFTLLHAAIQTYVLTTLVSIFYGEAVEPNPKKIKEKKA